MSKAYRWLVKLLRDESFTRTMALVVFTATFFALVFNAVVEIVAGMIVLGCITALLEYRIWTNEHRKQ